MTRELWFGGRLVKEFKRPASDQELILKAFQEQNRVRRQGARNGQGDFVDSR
jgi:hypothetical protein